MRLPPAMITHGIACLQRMGHPRSVLRVFINIHSTEIRIKGKNCVSVAKMPLDRNVHSQVKGNKAFQVHNMIH